MGKQIKIKTEDGSMSLKIRSDYERKREILNSFR